MCTLLLSTHHQATSTMLSCHMKRGAATAVPARLWRPGLQAYVQEVLRLVTLRVLPAPRRAQILLSCSYEVLRGLHKIHHGEVVQQQLLSHPPHSSATVCITFPVLRDISPGNDTHTVLWPPPRDRSTPPEWYSSSCSVRHPILAPVCPTTIVKISFQLRRQALCALRASSRGGHHVAGGADGLQHQSLGFRGTITCRAQMG